MTQADSIYCIGREWRECHPCASLPHIYFFVLHLYKQSSSEYSVALELEHAATFYRHDSIVAPARNSIYNRTFRGGDSRRD